MIDVHNHVLIGVDDGPQTRKEALALLKQASGSGITDIIATPHHKSPQHTTPSDTVMEKLQELHEIIEEEEVPIRVHPGQEIRINGEMLEELDSGYDLTMNNTQYVLVELPFNDMPNYTERLFFDLQMKGYIPLIAHPERCKPIIRDPQKLYDLVEKGAISQVTATCVTGDLGENLQKTSLKMIENNLAHIVASDAHNAETRPFALKEAYEVITEELGEAYTERFKKNAEKLLNDESLALKMPQPMASHYTDDRRKRKKKKKKFFGLF